MEFCPCYPCRCPYPDCRNDDPIGPEIGPWFRARWRHKRSPCCEWCRLWYEFNFDFFEMLLNIMEAEHPFYFGGKTDWFLSEFEMVHDFYKHSTLGEDECDTYDVALSVDEISQLVNAIVKAVRGGVLGYRALVRELAGMAAALRTNRPRELYYTMKTPKWCKYRPPVVI